MPVSNGTDHTPYFRVAVMHQTGVDRQSSFEYLHLWSIFFLHVDEQVFLFVTRQEIRVMGALNQIDYCVKPASAVVERICSTPSQPPTPPAPRRHRNNNNLFHNFIEKAGWFLSPCKRSDGRIWLNFSSLRKFSELSPLAGWNLFRVCITLQQAQGQVGWGRAADMAADIGQECYRKRPELSEEEEPISGEADP